MFNNINKLIHLNTNAAYLEIIDWLNSNCLIEVGKKLPEEISAVLVKEEGDFNSAEHFRSETKLKHSVLYLTVSVKDDVVCEVYSSFVLTVGDIKLAFTEIFLPLVNTLYDDTLKDKIPSPVVMYGGFNTSNRELSYMSKYVCCKGLGADISISYFLNDISISVSLKEFSEKRIELSSEYNQNLSEDDYYNLLISNILSVY